MRIYVYFIATNLDGSETLKGAFYLNAVSLDHADSKAQRVLSVMGLEAQTIGYKTEKSDEFLDLPFDTIIGLNGRIKMVGNYRDGETFERCAIIERGVYVAGTDLLESEVEAIKYI